LANTYIPFEPVVLLIAPEACVRRPAKTSAAAAGLGHTHTFALAMVEFDCSKAAERHTILAHFHWPSVFVPSEKLKIRRFVLSQRIFTLAAQVIQPVTFLSKAYLYMVVAEVCENAMRLECEYCSGATVVADVC